MTSGRWRKEGFDWGTLCDLELRPHRKPLPCALRTSSPTPLATHSHLNAEGTGFVLCCVSVVLGFHAPSSL